MRLNKVPGICMRAPGEAVGQLALECAMDELAHTLQIDPVEMRLRNEPEKHPEQRIPFSSRSLRECLAIGAELFGWSLRNKTPGTLRDGEWLVGHGMAVAARGNLFGPPKASVAIGADGRAVVKTEMTDIGTGTYTVLAQIVSYLLGLPLTSTDVHLGDTDDPASAGSGGPWGAATSGSAVYAACQGLREKLASAAGFPVEQVTFADGCLQSQGIRRPISELIGKGLAVAGSVDAGKALRGFSQASYGTHFCEVRVSAITGETRVMRWNSVLAAGRILNRKTDTSQCIGGIIFGIGGALTEELVHDVRTGKVVNRDLAGYHVPAHADIPDNDILLLVELLTSEALVAQPAKAGKLQGLADPVTARALVALHSDAAKRWTTSKLARLCGCSRSAFNLRFTSIVGIAPMRYLHRWRMAVAKDELGRGERSIAEIAFLIGFQSSGSFTKAFTRSVGCPPLQVRRRASHYR